MKIFEHINGNKFKISDGIKRDKYYYIQHILDMDVQSKSKELIDKLEETTEKWCKMYNPVLNGNEHGWHPVVVSTFELYELRMEPNIYRENNIFVIFSIEVTISKKKDFLSDKKTKIFCKEFPLSLESPDAHDWDFSSFTVTLQNILRQIRDLVKKDYD